MSTPTPVTSPPDASADDAATDPDAPGPVPDRPRHHRRDESGFALIWFALVLVALVAISGAAVDVWNWWYSGNQQQRAADAGALAGVVHLPGDPPAAQAAVLDVVGANEYPASAVLIETSTQDPTLAPNEVRVTVTDRPATRFLSLLGVGEPTVRRSAVAQYVDQLPMGSPEPFLGRDPEQGFDPGFWISISGRAEPKVGGDRYQDLPCGASQVWACSGGNSTEYDPNGYFFSVQLDTAPTGDLVIEAYDPVHTDTGAQDCTNNAQEYLNNGRWNSAKNAIDAQMTALGVTDALVRYEPGDTIWCQGDVGGGTNPSATSQNVTSFIVREPDDSPFSNLDNAPYNEFGPYDVAANPLTLTSSCTKQFRAIDLSPGGSSARGIYRILDLTDLPANPAAALAELVEGRYAQRAYRRWVPLCTIPQATVAGWRAAGLDEVIVQIRSNAALGSPLVPSTNPTTGRNHFALRAGYGTATAGGVSVFAEGRLPIHNGAVGASTTEFFLTRVLPGNAGRTLSLEFYDVADATRPAVFEVVPPPTFPAGFSDCEFTRYSGDQPPVDLSSSATGCTLSNVIQANYNGRMVDVRVKVPTGYSCNVADPDDCWIKVRVTYGAGGTVFDHTTWDAGVVGEPVRLIE